MLDGRRIEEFFPADFFQTEFWLLWSTIMGSLPQHGATEFRRYINRALRPVPRPLGHAHILRTPICQYQAFIEPLVAWLQARGVKLQTGTFVRDIGLRAGAGPHHRRTARLRAGWGGDPGRGRAGGSSCC